MLYYLTFFTLDKGYVSFFKIAYHEPRPYMVNSGIIPISCSRAFGNPSGHSSSAIIVPIVLFLDIFHGKTMRGHLPKYFNTPTYIICLFFAFLWALTVPFSRYVLGVHSLDQILFGVTLGFWGAITCHFVIRDHFIAHIEVALQHQGLLEGANENKNLGYSAHVAASPPDTSVNAIDESNAIDDKDEGRPFNPRCKVLGVITGYLIYLTASIVTFIIVDADLPPDSKEIVAYTANYEKSCGDLNPTYSF